jgi:hypothetical protein
MVANSRKIAGLVGPTLIVMLISEFPLVQPHLYDSQTPLMVYMSGILMFVAGLAIVREHNLWVRNWTILVTMTGWFFLLLGLIRMFAASLYLQSSTNTSATVFVVLEGLLLVLGFVMTFNAFAPNKK